MEVCSQQVFRGLEQQQQQQIRRRSTSSLAGGTHNTRRLTRKTLPCIEQQIVNEVNRKGTVIDNAAYASLLRWCGNEKALLHGRRLHAHMSTSGRDRNAFLTNLLVQMYGKCGSVEDARRVFDGIRQPDVFSWTFMISACAQNGCEVEALQLFRHMEMSSVKPNKFTVFPILSACASLGSLAEGKQIHRRIIEHGLESELSVRNALVNMYGKCGSARDARSLFDKMQERDVVSWNAMIAAYACNKQYKAALSLFRQMDMEGIHPDRITFLNILSALQTSAFLESGRWIHRRILVHGLQSDIAIRTALVNMYGKCNSPRDARLVFDEMHERDRILWNAMIAAYAQTGKGKDAFKLLQQMDLEGVAPDKVTFLSVLDACASIASLENGRMIHQRIVACGFESDLTVRNALVNMYGKCGSLRDAQSLFGEMDKRDVVSWTAMIAAYTQNRQSREALELFRQMESEGVNPNSITFISIVDACASLASLESGREIHECIIASGFEFDISIRNALVNMYGKCGSLSDARTVFDETLERDEISWNAIIGAYAQNGKGKEALELFHQMGIEGIKPNRITFLSILDVCSSSASLEYGKIIHEWIIASGFESDVAVRTALVNMYGKCGNLEDARLVFDGSHERDLISWNAMIAAYAQNGQGKEALTLFQQMDMEGVKPDRITFISVLYAFASLASLENGRMIHERIVASGFKSDVAVRNALVNMYGRCGSLKDAQALFSEMEELDVMSWNAMIAVYAQNGQGMEALELFWQMSIEGIKPDRITFVGILNACSHTGLLDESRLYFVSLSNDHNVVPLVEHYVCMIDLLGRAGFLNEADDLINNMPVQPSVVGWNSLLGACRVYGDVERGTRAAEHVSELDPKVSSQYVLLSNIYAAAGRWYDAANARKYMQLEEFV